MKEIIVKRDIIGRYSGIDLATAYGLITGGAYDYVGFQSDDRVIQVVFPTFEIKADEEKMKEELTKYFAYIESITGIEAPERIDL